VDTIVVEPVTEAGLNFWAIAVTVVAGLVICWITWAARKEIAEQGLGKK